MRTLVVIRVRDEMDARGFRTNAKQMENFLLRSQHDGDWAHEEALETSKLRAGDHSMRMHSLLGAQFSQKYVTAKHCGHYSTILTPYNSGSAGPHGTPLIVSCYPHVFFSIEHSRNQDQVAAFGGSGASVVSHGKNSGMSLLFRKA